MIADKTLKEVFDEAEEHFKEREITRDQITESFSLFWKNFKLFLKSNKFPTVLVPKWGRFVPRINKLYGWFHSVEDEDTKEELIKIINRLKREKQKRKRK